MDTDVLIDYLRDLPQAVQFLEAQPDGFAASAISVAALYQGVRGRGEEGRLAAFIASVNVESITTVIATRAGLFSRQYGPSHGSGLSDCIIAATAEQLGLSLATLNVWHYPMLADVASPLQPDALVRSVLTSHDDAPTLPPTH